MALMYVIFIFGNEGTLLYSLHTFSLQAVIYRQDHPSTLWWSCFSNYIEVTELWSIVTVTDSLKDTISIHILNCLYILSTMDLWKN